MNARMGDLIDVLTNWRQCEVCRSSGYEWHETSGGEYIEHGCTACGGSGYEECPPPDPAEYRANEDVSGDDRTELVEELYRLRGGTL